MVKQLFISENSTASEHDNVKSYSHTYMSLHVGYEPAGLTVHPPPKNDRGWVHFFRMGV